MNRTRDRLQEFRDLSRQYGGRGGWWKFRQRGVSKDEDVFLHQLKSKVNIHLRGFFRHVDASDTYLSRKNCLEKKQVGALERQAESVDPLGMTATIRILKGDSRD